MILNVQLNQIKVLNFLAEQNLNNSTQLIRRSTPASTTIYEDITNSFNNIMHYFGIDFRIDTSFGIKKTREPEEILGVTKFGSFTANFRELPPPQLLPPEYWATLFGVVVTAFVSSWLTPTIIGWRKAKKHQNKLNDYQNELEDLHKDNKLDKRDIDNLDRLRDKVIAAYAKGDLTKEQYDVLLNNASTKYNEIFQNEINLLKNTPNNENKALLINEIQSNLDNAYLKEKINEKHYNLLKEKISELEKSINRK